jgi:RNA polymerase sigma factor (sigma-70 family)
MNRSEAARTLVENHRVFLDFLERRLGDRAVAEDILQEAFVRGIDRAGQLRESESAVAWFYRLLRNAVIDHHRRQGASRRALTAAAAEAWGAEAPAPETTAAVCQCVRRLAATLKPEYAAALERVDVDGVAVKDFAAEAGITANNASVRLHRAREALRRRVRDSCGTCAEHGCLDCYCAG